MTRHCERCDTAIVWPLDRYCPKCWNDILKERRSKMPKLKHTVTKTTTEIHRLTLTTDQVRDAIRQYVADAAWAVPKNVTIEFDAPGHFLELGLSETEGWVLHWTHKEESDE